MEFEEHEDPDEEMEIPGQTASGGYDTLPNSRTSVGPTAVEGSLAGGGGGGRRPSASVRYRECLKNHAVGIGGDAVDGCGEFMAAGEEGTLDALRCAACNCHRNFHRKEAESATDAVGGSGGAAATPLLFPHAHPHHTHLHHQFSSYYRAAPPPAGYLHITPPRPLALPSASGGGTHSREELEDVSNPSSSGGGGGGSGSGAMGMVSMMNKKRFRTKFTAEQKEKMLSFAERLGWRIQKHDDAAVEQFCSETGLKRHVLKVWMHNNKHTLGKKP